MADFPAIVFEIEERAEGEHFFSMDEGETWAGPYASQEAAIEAAKGLVEKSLEEFVKKALGVN